MSADDEARARHLDNLNAVYRHLVEQEPVARPVAVATPTRAQPSRTGMWGLLVTVGLFAATKLKAVGALAGVAKFQTLGSMLLSVAAYATQWGFPFAVGFVLLIFVHELGHAIVLRWRGIAAGAPVFIPFVGAVIAMRGRPRNAYEEAEVGIGGPVLGTVGAWAVLVAALFTGSPFLGALAHVGLLINLFNLIPVSPLDGGRIAGVFSRPVWFLGYALGVTTFLVTRSPMLFLVLLVGLWTLVERLRHPVPGYDAVSSRKRWTMAGAYLGLIAAIGWTLAVASDVAAGTG